VLYRIGGGNENSKDAGLIKFMSEVKTLHRKKEGTY